MLASCVEDAYLGAFLASVIEMLTRILLHSTAGNPLDVVGRLLWRHPTGNETSGKETAAPPSFAQNEHHGSPPIARGTGCQMRVLRVVRSAWGILMCKRTRHPTKQGEQNGKLYCPVDLRNICKTLELRITAAESLSPCMRATRDCTKKKAKMLRIGDFSLWSLVPKVQR